MATNNFKSYCQGKYVCNCIEPFIATQIYIFLKGKCFLSIKVVLARKKRAIVYAN